MDKRVLGFIDVKENQADCVTAALGLPGYFVLFQRIYSPFDSHVGAFQLAFNKFFDFHDVPPEK
jgi:hypothetical protein